MDETEVRCQDISCGNRTTTTVSNETALWDSLRESLGSVLEQSGGDMTSFAVDTLSLPLRRQ